MCFSHRNIFLLCWIQWRTISKSINVLPTSLCTTKGAKEHEIADCVTTRLLKVSAFHSCNVTLYLFLKDKILTLSLSMDSGLNCSLWGRWKSKCGSWNRWKPPKRLQFLKLWCPKLDKPSAAHWKIVKTPAVNSRNQSASLYLVALDNPFPTHSQTIMEAQLNHPSSTIGSLCSHLFIFYQTGI